MSVIEEDNEGSTFGKNGAESWRPLRMLAQVIACVRRGIPISADFGVGRKF
jgi:hypothetical protein